MTPISRHEAFLVADSTRVELNLGVSIKGERRRFIGRAGTKLCMQYNHTRINTMSLLAFSIRLFYL